MDYDDNDIFGEADDREENASLTTQSARDALKNFVERIERLESQKAALGDDVKSVYAEAKATGFDTKAIRELIKRRAADPNALEEFEQLLETYENALKGVDSDEEKA